jgi:hypothetical protein
VPASLPPQLIIVSVRDDTPAHGAPPDLPTMINRG